MRPVLSRIGGKGTPHDASSPSPPTRGKGPGLGGLGCALSVALLACSTPVLDKPAPPPVASAPPVAHSRPQLDGRAFPDHVLALTYDDGPDAHTLDLASFLASQHVSATFFVVHDWSPDVSEEPGRGAHVFETGYAFLPVLHDLAALGHRVGNHTKNHVLLAPAQPSVILSQLRDNQAELDPFLEGEPRFFRVPGGAWDDSAAAVVDRDPLLRDLVGPIRWDIDRKDWEGSLYCRSDRPSVECEPAAPGRESRVRAEVTAARYLESIAATGHGIVLFHDRVGDVGSDYALRVARRVVPELEAKGYVFGPPVLELGAFRTRSDALPLSRASRERGPGGEGLRAGSAALRGDINGDGRVDTCSLTADGLSCALESAKGPLDASIWLARSRKDAPPWLGGSLFLVDVNADGRADLCSTVGAEVACALAP